MKPLMAKTFIFSIALATITAVLKYTAIVPAIHSQWHFILVFYFVLTTFILLQLLKAFRKTTRKFITTFLSMTVLRMILFTAIILLYAFLIKHDDTRNVVGFVLTFSVYYLIFTTWEIVLIVPFLKNKKSE